MSDAWRQGKSNATVWRPSVRPSVWPISFSDLDKARGAYSTWLTTAGGQQATRPAYIFIQVLRWWTHLLCLQGKLKEVTLARMSELVIKDPRLPVLLDRCAYHSLYYRLAWTIMFNVAYVCVCGWMCKVVNVVFMVHRIGCVVTVTRKRFFSPTASTTTPT